MTNTFVNSLLGGRHKEYAPRVSFNKLIQLGDKRKLKWDGKYCDLTMKRDGNKCEIQTFEFDGIICKNYSEAFMVDMAELKKYNKL